MSTDISTINNEVSNIKGSSFNDIGAFENAQRMATALSKSNIVPIAYQNNIPNTMVAMEMAVRVGVSPLMVMQNLDIIHGKPSWKSSFIIAALNSCGRFSPLRFKFEGDISDENFGCRAYATDLSAKEVIYGTKITWLMVRSEGWDKPKKNQQSKWQTMPEQMFQYRSASFFGRIYAPDILTGMYSIEESIDIAKQNMQNNNVDLKLKELEDLFNNYSFEGLTEDERIHITRVIQNKESISYEKAINVLNSKLDEQYE